MFYYSSINSQSNYIVEYVWVEYPEGETPIHRIELEVNGRFNYKMTFCYDYFYGEGSFQIDSSNIKLNFEGPFSSFEVEDYRSKNLNNLNSFKISKIYPMLEKDEVVELTYYHQGMEFSQFIDNDTIEIQLPNMVESINFRRKGFDSIEIPIDLESESNKMYKLYFVKIPYGFEKNEGVWEMRFHTNNGKIYMDDYQKN